jgi:hypothetical protein
MLGSRTPPRLSPSKSEPVVGTLSQDEQDIIEFIKKENFIKSDAEMMQFMQSDNYKQIIGDNGGPPGEDFQNLTNEDLSESLGENGQALSKHLLLRILYNIRESTKEQVFKVKGHYRGKRRQNYDNQEKYAKYSEKLFTTIDKILKKSSVEILKEIGVSQELFDKSIEINQDHEVEEYIKNLATCDKNVTVRPIIEEGTVKKIIAYHEKVYIDLSQSFPDPADNDLMSAGIEDEIFFKFNVEFEEVAAHYF